MPGPCKLSVFRVDIKSVLANQVKKSSGCQVLSSGGEDEMAVCTNFPTHTPWHKDGAGPAVTNEASAWNFDWIGR